MLHRMKLQDGPFSKIRSGEKTIELRLFDEKRQQLSVNDIIEFSHSDDSSLTVCARVIALHRFASFHELYSALPLDKCGYTAEEIPNASPADMEKYYPKEEQLRFGVLGIEIKLV